MPGRLMSVFLAVFSSPVRAYELIKEPGISARFFFLAYGMPLLIAASVGRMFAVEVPGGGILQSLFVALSNMIAYATAVLAGSYLIAKLAAPFQSKSDRALVMKIILLSFTPFFLSQAVHALIPRVHYLGLAALVFTVFLFGKGLHALFETPYPKVAGFTFISFFILLGIAWVINLLVSGLLIYAPQ